jgi:hypothetical protein
MMDLLPIHVDPTWYERTWYGDRPQRKTLRLVGRTVRLLGFAIASLSVRLTAAITWVTHGAFMTESASNPSHWLPDPRVKL